jgi:uncharacterized protein with ParB-like and HNH nuclease domain
MDSNAAPLLAIFEKKQRLEVPLFQRQYVWNKDHQWEPLWEDISRKFVEYIQGRKDAPVHFLGAMVLDQKMTPSTHVEKRQVIDGQQRLATFQIFLSAMRDFCNEQNLADLAAEYESFTINKGMMANPEVDKYKVWPTLLDRAQFIDVISSGSRDELLRKYPLRYRKWARKPDPRPRMIDAYLYFYKSIYEFFLGNGSEPIIGSDIPLSGRLEECLQALKNALKVVVIDLAMDDDAQVIFETLNARGEPLLPADLLRNYIFLRAARTGEPQEQLYSEYWQKFDDPFWREEVRQGRLNRPRSDLFMQHFLASRRAEDIPIKHLYVEYKWWIERKQPFPSIRAELEALSRQGDDFRRIIEPKKDDILYPLLTFLNKYDVGTVTPLILCLLDSSLGDDELSSIGISIESYLLRRSVCGITTKNYNRIFLGLTKYLREKGINAGNVRQYLSQLNGESVEWPMDDKFKEAWQNRHIFQTLYNSDRIGFILQRLNEKLYGHKMEKISVEGYLTIEHIMPQNWIKNWPLPDGSNGIESAELFETQPGDKRAEATRVRNEALQTVGNLTILTQCLNSSLSNSAWNIKKPELLRLSLLPINQMLVDYDHWDEKTIETRSLRLFEKAIDIWPSPDKNND